MQLKNRLNKMEKQLNTGAGFCECPDTPKHEFIHRREGESTEVPPDKPCDKCGKPVEKTTIILQFVKAKKPDWMSDEQYAAAYPEPEN